jgi:transcriptional regulator with XRE-family HTH domain
MSVTAGSKIREERLRRRWTLAELADRAGISRSLVAALESGGVVSLDTYARVAVALGLRAELDAVDPRHRHRGRPQTDFVHAAMGELEAGRLRSFGFRVAVDEPYQHYQFAGRADVVAADLEQRALLHLENRTRYPDLQEAIGSYNAKRSFLADELAERWQVTGGWRSVAHVMVALWSSEVVHVLRLRTETFRAVCSEPIDDFATWWSGRPPVTHRPTSSLAVLDPLPARRELYRFAGLDQALGARPRYAGYAEAAAALRATAVAPRPKNQ